MRIQPLAAPVLASTPRAPSAGADEGLRRAVRRFVEESNSSEGRRLKQEALRRIASVAPDLSADHVAALERLVYPSNSLEGRAAKLDGVVRLFQARPDLSPSVLRDVADFVNDSNGAAGYSMKLDYLVDMVRARPDLDGPFVNQLTRLMAASNSLEGKDAKLSGMLAVLRAHPGITLDQVRPIVTCVNQSESATGYRTKLHGFARLLALKPAATPSFLSAVGDFICDSNSSEGYDLKFDFLGKVLAKRPDLDESFLSELTWLMSASNSIPGKSAKLDGVYKVLCDHPAVTSDQLRGIISCVNRSNDPTAYEAKLEGFKRILDRKPDASERFLRALGAFIDTGDGTRERIDRIQAVLNMMDARPGLEAEDIEEATRAASQGLGELDARHRVEVSFWRRQVEGALAAAGPLPDPPQGLPPALVAAAAMQPEVVAAYEALRLGMQRLGYYESLGSAPRRELFGKERALHQRCAASVGDPKLLHMGLSAAAGALTLAIPPLWAFQPVVFWAAAIGFGLKGQAVTRKVGHWLNDGKVERKMREALEAPQSYWQGQVDGLKALHVEATRAAVLRLSRERDRADPSAGEIEVEESRVNVGGIILDRMPAEA